MERAFAQRRGGKHPLDTSKAALASNPAGGPFLFLPQRAAERKETTGGIEWGKRRTFSLYRPSAAGSRRRPDAEMKADLKREDKLRYLICVSV